MSTNVKLILGVILVIVGVVFLGSINNLLHFNWLYLGLLGVTLQIILGLWLLLPQKTARVWAAVGVVLVVFVAVALIPEARARFIGERSVTRLATSTNQPLQLEMNMQDVDVSVDALAVNTNANSLYSATAEGFRLNEHFTSKNGAEHASLGMVQQPFSGGTRTLSTAISPSVPLTLDINVDRGSAMLDLRSLALERLILDCDNTDATLMLGERNATQHVEIDCKDSTVNVRIPRSAALQLIPAEADEPLSGNYDSLGLVRKDNALASADFDTNTQRIIFVLEDDDTAILITRY